MYSDKVQEVLSQLAAGIGDLSIGRLFLMTIAVVCWINIVLIRDTELDSSLHISSAIASTTSISTRLASILAL